jgi:outer membrane protease
MMNFPYPTKEKSLTPSSVATSAALFAASAVSLTAFAGVVPLPQAARGGEGVRTAIAVNAAYLAGEAREHVFFKDRSERVFPDKRRHQVSRLDWDMDDVFLLGLSGSVRSGRASLNLGVWGGLGRDDAGKLEDYDWLMGDTREIHGPLWEGASEYSKSDDTVKSAWMADANVSFDLCSAESTFNVFPFAGVRYERYEWDSKGGWALYSRLDWQHGEFDDGTNLKYRQEYFQPYVGLGASWTINRLSLSAYGRFAPVYWGKDRDNHIRRGYVTEDETGWEAFDDVAWGLGARAGWSFTETLALHVGIDWTRYALAEADTKVLANGDGGGDGGGEQMEIRKFGGLELECLAVSAGLAWRF